MDSDSGRLKHLTIRSAVATAVLVSLLGLFGYVLQLALGDQIPAVYLNVLLTAALVGATFVATYAVGYGLSHLQDEGSVTPHQKEVSYRFIQLLTFAGVLFIVVVYVWEVTVANVVLGAGVTSVVLALAARQTLSSVLSGIIIMSTDIFRVGDWVKIDDRFGQIRRISFFNTEVRSPQGEIHVFPNDDLAARDITNLGSGRYRNDVLVGVDYGTDVGGAIAVCDSILQELTANRENHVDGFHPTTVKDFDDSQITLAVKMWVDEPRPQVINEAQTTVLSQIHRRFQDEQIEIPFPQRTVSERETA